MDKSAYKLQPNEVMIMKFENVRHGNASGELVLTNQNLIHVACKGIFRTTYIAQKYPIKNIKVFEGRAQIFLGKAGNMDIYLINGQQSFIFWNNESLFSEKKAEKEAEKWASAINKLLTGDEADMNLSSKKGIPEIEILADAVGETFGALKNALGICKKAPPAPTEVIAKKCESCGASISGRKGKSARCAYCGNSQTM